MTRVLMLAAMAPLILWQAASAVAEPIFSVGGSILGEGGPFYEGFDFGATPVSISGSHEANSVAASANWDFVEAEAIADGVTATASSSAKFSNTYFFKDELGEPISIGTVAITASFMGIANDNTSAEGFLDVFGLFDFDGDSDTFSVHSGSDSGQLFVEWTGDFTAGVVVSIEAKASVGGDGGGGSNSFVRIDSITVDGIPVQMAPEPSTLALAGMGAVGGLLWGVRRKNSAR